MTSANFRGSIYSERSIKRLSYKLANELMQHDSQVRSSLPEDRVPNAKEFKQLVHSVHGVDSRASDQVNTVHVYKSLRDIYQRRIDQKNLQRMKSSLSTRLSHSNRTSNLDFKTRPRDVDHKQGILRENLSLLRRISEIQQVHGKVDSFNRSFKPPPPNIKRIKEAAATLSRQNIQLGCRLLKVKSKVDCHNAACPPPVKVPSVGADLLRKYSSFMPLVAPPKHAPSPRALLRPIVYFDLAVRGEPPFGRISIQLYTEVSPEVVLEFVRLANSNDVKAHRFTHIFPDLWMEGELLPQSRNALDNHYSDDESPLDASQSKGLLSYSWSYRKHFPQGILLYSISFKTLSVVPLQRVIFGRVLYGMRLLEVCRDYGNRSGKLRRSIDVIKCGLL